MTRQMTSPEGHPRGVGGEHLGPHDWAWYCDIDPKCQELKLEGPGEPPRERSRYVYPEYHEDSTACNDTECDRYHFMTRADVPPAKEAEKPESLPYDPPPKHYDGNGMDPWAVWDAFDLDRYTANAVKYLLRAGKKDIAPRLDDLRKAANYIAKAIEMEEKK